MTNVGPQGLKVQCLKFDLLFSCLLEMNTLPQYIFEGGLPDSPPSKKFIKLKYKNVIYIYRLPLNVDSFKVSTQLIFDK